MKSTLLLATGLFLISAPAPDADDVAEMTSNLLSPKHVAGTLASDEQLDNGDIAPHPAQVYLQEPDRAVASLRLPGAGQDTPAGPPTG